MAALWLALAACPLLAAAAPHPDPGGAPVFLDAASPAAPGRKMLAGASPLEALGLGLGRRLTGARAPASRPPATPPSHPRSFPARRARADSQPWATSGGPRAPGAARPRRPLARD
jgi:hypothetical protein